MAEDTEVLRQKVQRLEMLVKAIQQGKLENIPVGAANATTGQLYVDTSDNNRIKRK